MDFHLITEHNFKKWRNKMKNKLSSLTLMECVEIIMSAVVGCFVLWAFFVFALNITGGM